MGRFSRQQRIVCNGNYFDARTPVFSILVPAVDQPKSPADDRMQTASVLRSGNRAIENALILATCDKNSDQVSRQGNGLVEYKTSLRLCNNAININIQGHQRNYETLWGCMEAEVPVSVSHVDAR